MQPVGFSTINFRSKNTMAKTSVNSGKKVAKETIDALKLRANEIYTWDSLRRGIAPEPYSRGMGVDGGYCWAMNPDTFFDAGSIKKGVIGDLEKAIGEHISFPTIPASFHNEVMIQVNKNVIKKQINKLEQKLATETLSEAERKDILKALEVLKMPRQNIERSREYSLLESRPHLD